MATFTWNGYFGGSRAWTSIASNTIVFCGSTTDITTPITVGSMNGATHIGNGDPGTDQCATNHLRNVAWVSNTQFALDGGGTETLNDTNLIATECTLQILFTDASSVATSNARVYCFNSTTSTTFAPGVIAYGFQQGVSDTSWTKINDATGSTGGDNAGVRLDLDAQGAATDHTFYVALSAGPQSVGSKGDFDFGIALTYS